MLEVFAERGGDPDRPGKRNRLDALLWRAHRGGEPSWDGGQLGPGRPGWHIECACIACDRLGVPIDIQGGGTDLIFPHHEMSAAHARAFSGTPTFARAYVHQGMVGLDGEKMSKSKGNLVFVSELRRRGVDPMAIRLALLARHHAEDWFWEDSDLTSGQQRLATWRAAVSGNGGPPAEETVAEVRGALADDLDSPRALAAVDRWAKEALTTAATTLARPACWPELSTHSSASASEDSATPWAPRSSRRVGRCVGVLRSEARSSGGALDRKPAQWLRNE